LSEYAGAAAYQAYETGYNLQQTLTDSGTKSMAWYGQPFSYQTGRTMRFEVRYVF